LGRIKAQQHPGSIYACRIVAKSRQTSTGLFAWSDHGSLLLILETDL
jgi:hypothetical protein